MATKRRAETAQENREKMIQAARKAFAEKGYAAASMDELTASVGLTRGALYHNFNDKKGLLAAVVAQIDSEMAANAKAIAAAAEDDWERLLAEGIAYIKRRSFRKFSVSSSLTARLFWATRRNGPARTAALSRPVRPSKK